MNKPVPLPRCLIIRQLIDKKGDKHTYIVATETGFENAEKKVEFLENQKNEFFKNLIKAGKEVQKALMDRKPFTFKKEKYSIFDIMEDRDLIGLCTRVYGKANIKYKIEDIK